jgi:hypothetical protein
MHRKAFGDGECSEGSHAVLAKAYRRACKAHHPG